MTSQVQLFVDDFLIQEMQGVARSLHTPSKARENPVLVADRPWEGGLSLEAGTVLYEPGRGIFKRQEGLRELVSSWVTSKNQLLISIAERPTWGVLEMEESSPPR